MLNKFELLMPYRLDEALNQYAESGGKCKIVAGELTCLLKCMAAIRHILCSWI